MKESALLNRNIVLSVSFKRLNDGCLSTMKLGRYVTLYNNPSYSRILIGSRLWSIRGQTHDWRHHYKVFLSAVLKWRKVLRIRIIFSITGQKIRYKNVLPRHWTGSRSQKTKDKAFLLASDQEIISSSLSRQSSETKPRTNLVLVSREPLLYLEFNKPNKRNVSEINLFKKFNFSLCQNNCWHADWCQEWNIKTSLLKISNLNKIHNLAFRCECSCPFQGTAAS